MERIRKKRKLLRFFHDMLKGRDSETLNAYVREFGLEDKYIDNPNLAHGKIAAILMERDYGITGPRYNKQYHIIRRDARECRCSKRLYI